MEMVFGWIRNLVFYLVLMTMIMNLLPNREYEKYLRLFAGMVFFMLLIQPFTDLTGMEQQMEEAFERLTFQNEAKMLRRKIEDINESQMQELTELYEGGEYYGVEEGDTAVVLENE